jgi:hypothetical protein
MDDLEAAAMYQRATELNPSNYASVGNGHQN